MLSFNLGVFFRNLEGEEVALAATSAQSILRFSGNVAGLETHTDLSQHLSVTLKNGDLTCQLRFEEIEEEEAQELAEVEVEILQHKHDKETLFFKTSFRFDEITLKPATPPPPEQEPPRSA